MIRWLRHAASVSLLSAILATSSIAQEVDSTMMEYDLPELTVQSDERVSSATFDKQVVDLGFVETPLGASQPPGVVEVVRTPGANPWSPRGAVQLIPNANRFSDVVTIYTQQGEFIDPVKGELVLSPTPTFVYRVGSVDSTSATIAADLLSRQVHSGVVRDNSEFAVRASNRCPVLLRRAIPVLNTLACGSVIGGSIKHYVGNMFVVADGLQHASSLERTPPVGIKKLTAIAIDDSRYAATVGLTFPSGVVSVSGISSSSNGQISFVDEGLVLGREKYSHLIGVGALAKFNQVGLRVEYSFQDYETVDHILWNAADVPGHNPEVVQSIIPKTRQFHSVSVSKLLFPFESTFLELQSGVKHLPFSDDVLVDGAITLEYSDGASAKLQVGVNHNPIRSSSLLGRFFEDVGDFDVYRFVSFEGCIPSDTNSVCLYATSQFNSVSLLQQSGSQVIRGFDVMYSSSFDLGDVSVSGDVGVSLYTGTFNGKTAPYIPAVQVPVSVSASLGRWQANIDYNHSSGARFGVREQGNIFTRSQPSTNASSASFAYAIAKDATVGFLTIFPSRQAFGKEGVGDKTPIIYSLVSTINL